MSNSSVLMFQFLGMMLSAVVIMLVIEQVVIRLRNATYLRFEFGGIKVVQRVRDKDHAQAMANGLSLYTFKNIEVIDCLGRVTHKMHNSGRLVRVNEGKNHGK